MLRLLLIAVLLFIVPVARANDDEIANGEILVEENCSRCHAVALSDQSLHPDAPAFRTLSQRYPIEALAESLAEGISTGHPDMPEFTASPDQIDAIIAYMRSINP